MEFFWHQQQRLAINNRQHGYFHSDDLAKHEAIETISY